MYICINVDNVNICISISFVAMTSNLSIFRSDNKENFLMFRGIYNILLLFLIVYRVICLTRFAPLYFVCLSSCQGI